MEKKIKKTTTKNQNKQTKKQCLTLNYLNVLLFCDEFK